MNAQKPLNRLQFHHNLIGHNKVDAALAGGLDTFVYDGQFYLREEWNFPQP